MNIALGALDDSEEIPLPVAMATGQVRILSRNLGANVSFRRPDMVPETMLVHRRPDGTLRTLGLGGGAIVEIESDGDWPGLGAAVRMMHDAAAMDAWRLALFQQCGEVSVESVPLGGGSDKVVCHCLGVTRGAIEALSDRCHDRVSIGKACGAGTVCGGCSIPLDEIVAGSTMSEAELVGIERIDANHARFRFRYLSPGLVLPAAGAYLQVQAVISGRWIGRPYTLVASHDDESVEIIVKREPSGILSRWLHEHAEAGQAFRLSAPQSTREPGHSARMVFIAAGVGITPALSRMETLGEGLSVHWSLRGGESAPLARHVARIAGASGCGLIVHDTASLGRVEDWASLFPLGCADQAVICGPVGFQERVCAALAAAGWDPANVTVESFASRRMAPLLSHVDSFDYLQEPVVAESFHAVPVASVEKEARAFLRQFYFEHGAPAAFEARWAMVEAEIGATGGYRHTYDELAFGARLAWRNSARCIGRFFWKSLAVRDLRHLRTEDEIFEAVVSHLRTATGGGDIQPIITVFDPTGPEIRIVNPQLILYAGYRDEDGRVTGDPKNVDLTRMAEGLGWAGKGTRFDVLPVIIRIGNRSPRLFELPEDAVLQVLLSHPRSAAFGELGLRWFAVPAVSGMALDIGGIQYTAAPSNGFYMGTEIGSVNMADPSRYDMCAAVAETMGIETGPANPLWRDQAMLDLNVAVLHSFTAAGVRILDHHALSDYFVRFREAEALAGRPSYGHWAWVMPPMGGNLSPIWRDSTLRKKILKPNYFYQAMDTSE